MRRLSLTVVGIVAGLTTLAACGTTISGSPEPSVTSATSLAALVGGRTSAVTTTQYHLDISAAGVQITGQGQVQFAGANTKMQMNMTTPMGDIDAILIGGTMYLKVPQSVAQTPKPWVKFDANGTDSVSKALSAVTSQEQQNLDPTKTLTMIAPFATITGTRQDPVDGTPATEYTISVDTAKLMQSTMITQQMRDLLNGSGVHLPAHLNYQLWLNSSNLPVKLVVVEPVSVPGSGSQTVTVSMTYSNWGQPVNIQAPPAGQVGWLSGN